MVYELIKEFIPVKTCLKERNDGEFLIVSNKDLSIYYLNETAREFYNWIDNKASVSEIMKKFIETYDVDVTVLERDIMHLVRDLQWKHLLVLKGAINSEKVS